MTGLRILVMILIGFLALSLTAQEQSAREQFNQLVQKLQSSPNDNGLREQIIKLARDLKPAPAIPEEARRSAVKGTVFKESATDRAGQMLAVAAFKEAVRIAPWWGEIYNDLAKVQELAGQPDEE